ncbi:MAG: hypothetical protein DRH23_05255 [Deltaproteobacteria bacterium]|nr:hypothetical protein [Deltaproteobacteria bacterium]MBW2224806.1 hypothetical protein [Deltaproteobacteria bacterium]MBW2403300.1 hypothetical protein [Deltaproteobacteria bacterium]MBW2546909.1 hypothetical protein [Deltaproteobacteria bacterium]MBW2720043.1 hypothetical protein [Deltaproteobacteria bacterium]
MINFGLRFFVVSCLVLGLGACSSSGNNNTVVVETPTSYRDTGPWEAGVTTLALADRLVEVWYPVSPADTDGLETDPYFIRDALSDTLESLLPDDINPPFPTAAYRDARVSSGEPFPLVIFAHGSSSYRNQSTFLTTHLASWGFVVASVDYLERGLGLVLGDAPDPALDDVDLTRMVVALLSSENERDGALLAGRVSTERIAITGHSAGGGTAIRFGGEPDVVTYIPLSAGVSRDGAVVLPDKPSLWLAGDIDGIVAPERTSDAFAVASAPARFVLIEDMGHLGPSDICVIGENGGGIIQIALDANLPLSENLIRLGTDGCQPEALTIEDGWPTIRHFVTSQLRWAFGFDAEPVGLSNEVAEELPGATFTYQETL